MSRRALKPDKYLRYVRTRAFEKRRMAIYREVIPRTFWIAGAWERLCLRLEEESEHMYMATPCALATYAYIVSLMIEYLKQYPDPRRYLALQRVMKHDEEQAKPYVDWMQTHGVMEDDERKLFAQSLAFIDIYATQVQHACTSLPKLK